jgi:CO/xanthine dehydrogenase Mo-binding subunit
VKRVDDTAAKAVKGVRQIVRLDDAVAVIADHMGAAKKGLAALKIEWDDGPHAKLTTDAIAGELEKATLGSGAVAQNIGDVDKAMASAVTKVEATYHLPFLAHATMEPMNCTVHVRKDGCEIWIGSQAVARVQAAAAKTAGLPLDKVVVHNHLIGGGFGRRLEADGAARAVQIAQHVDGPVKVVRKISSTTCTGLTGSIGFPPVSMRKECPSPGTIASPAPRSRRDGHLRGSRTVSIPTPPKGQSTLSMRSPTCTSSMCGWNLRGFRLRSGAASGRPTTCS